MNVIVPEVRNAATSARTFFSQLGIIPTILLAAGVIVVLFYAWDGLSNWAQAAWANHQIESLQKQSEADKAAATAARTEAEQYKGAAAAYKEQAAALQNQITELQNARPELQQKSAEAGRKVEDIRNRAIKPIDGNIRQRVDDLSTSLDQLYPD